MSGESGRIGRAFTHTARVFAKVIKAQQGPQLVAHLGRQGIDVAVPDALSDPEQLCRLLASGAQALITTAELFGNGRFRTIQEHRQDLRALRAMKATGPTCAAAYEILSFPSVSTPDLQKNGVIGAGKMGQGFALNSAREGIEIEVTDENFDQLERGRLQTLKTLAEEVANGKSTVEEASAIYQRIHWTTSLDEVVRDTYVVHEAVFEDRDLKVSVIQKALEASDRVNGKDHGPIIATNTSSLSVQDLAEVSGRPDRVIGFHGFVPFDGNDAIEVVTFQGCSGEALQRALETGHLLRKTVVEVRDLPGFAGNRIFVSSRNEAYRIYGELVELYKGRDMTEEALRSALIALIDEVAKKTLGAKFGPFEVFNFGAEKGKFNEVAYQSTTSLSKAFGRGYEVAPELEAQRVRSKPWPTGGKYEDFHKIIGNDALAQLKIEIAEKLLGVEFVVAAQVVEEGIVKNAGELHVLFRTAYRRSSPLELMNAKDQAQVNQLARAAVERRSFSLPRRFESDTPAWLLPRAIHSISDGIATITLNQPDRLNPLDLQTWRDLRTGVAAAMEAGVRLLVITGRGKAFAAGADIDYLIDRLKRRDMDDLMHLGREVHDTLSSLNEAPFVTVSIVNGVSLGGGCDLALASNLVIAAPEAQFGLPEEERGIIPGYGGIWSVAHRAGVGIARAMVHGNLQPSGQLAMELGLADYVMENRGERDDLITALAEQISPRTDKAQNVARLKEFLSEKTQREPVTVSWESKTRPSLHAAKITEQLILQSGSATTLREGLAQAMAVRQQVLEHPDALEGFLAAKERRVPKFAS